MQQRRMTDWTDIACSTCSASRSGLLVPVEIRPEAERGGNPCNNGPPEYFLGKVLMPNACLI